MRSHQPARLTPKTWSCLQNRRKTLLKALKKVQRHERKKKQQKLFWRKNLRFWHLLTHQPSPNHRPRSPPTAFASLPSSLLEPTRRVSPRPGRQPLERLLVEAQASNVFRQLGSCLSQKRLDKKMKMKAPPSYKKYRFGLSSSCFPFLSATCEYSKAPLKSKTFVCVSAGIRRSKTCET